MATKPYTGPWFSYPTPNELLAAGTVLPAVAMFVVASRFNVRRNQKMKKGWDDWLTLPALLMIIGMGICIIYGVSHKVMGYPGGGVDPEDPTAVSKTTETLQKIEFAMLQLMTAGYGCIKISVLCFYRRLFNVRHGALFDRATQAFIALVIVWTAGFYFACAFVCGTHFDKYWGNVLAEAQYCPHGLEIYEGLLISNLITDVLILSIPVPIVWKLHASFGRKLAITGILLLGAMATAASATRLALFRMQVNRGYDPTEDTALAISTQLYWSMIEASLALIAACLPSFGNVLSRATLQLMLQNARSAIELFSLSSNRSRRSHERDVENGDSSAPYRELKHEASKSSKVQFTGVPADCPSIEINHQVSGSDSPAAIKLPDLIMVKKSISLQEELLRGSK